MILVNKTYCEVTPESAEDGDFSDTGFVFENWPYSFTELVRLMRDYTIASQHPPNGGTHEWYSCGFDVVDYGTGTERETSIHFSRDNHPRAAKYWRLAAIAAGLVERKCLAV